MCLEILLLKAKADKILIFARASYPFKSNFDWGNFMFTSFFNILYKSNHKDILCCAKAFYAQDLKGYQNFVYKGETSVAAATKKEFLSADESSILILEESDALKFSTTVTSANVFVSVLEQDRT